MPPKTNRLALRELRALTSLLQAVLLALDHTGVAREVASLLQVGAVVAGLEQSASDAVAQSASLTGDAAAIAASDYVEVTLGVGYLERSGCVVEKSLDGRSNSTPSRPLTVTLPVPGTMRTRATAFLRRPVP